MNPIEAMQAEIEYQIPDLYELDLLSPSFSSPPAPAKNSIFVGSGDSYVAGLAAHYFSQNSLITCCYPVDIIQNPLLIKGRNLFVISVSGNTQANIVAAKTAKKYGANAVIGITAKASSRLTESCDQIIELKYRNSGTITAGTISFTVSMIRCISLTMSLRLPSDLGKIYSSAEKQAEKAIGMINDKGNAGGIGGGGGSTRDSSRSYFLLGNSELYAIAKYGTLKFNEVFGSRAVAYPVEEFCHSPLFSIKETDQVIVLGDDDQGGKLSQRLNKEGFPSLHVGFNNTGIELLLQATFFIQLFVLKIAQKCGLTSCYFLQNKKLLGVSSDFIYH
ncbi:MAG: SIS domain-containing protein [Thermoproteota archaeon]|nr:SIS domain-containing protein [Thermoproteota archaeon]